MNARSRWSWWTTRLGALLVPAAIWLVSAAALAADDERKDKPAAERREGDGPARENGAGLEDFKPQTDREEALFKRVKQLEDQLAQLRREMAQLRGNQRDGDVRRKPGPRDGDAPRRPGPRDGDVRRKPGPRDGEGPPKPGPRDGEGPPKPGPRDGEKPAAPKNPDIS